MKGIAAAKSLVGPAPGLWAVAALTLCLALMLGGGRVPGLRGDAVVQLAALALIVMALLRLAERPAEAALRRPVALAALIVALPLLQLIPLPPELWTRLPGRFLAVESFEAADLGRPWWPISLDPAATWRSFLTMLPPLGLFLAIVALEARARRGLVLLVLAIGVVAVALGLLQLMQGHSSPLRFYEITNPGSSVGFFANRNHHAALLYSLLPFALAWTAWLVSGRRGQSLAPVWTGSVVIILLLGAAMTFSRAGVALAIAGFAMSLMMFARSGESVRGAFYAALALAALAAFVLAAYALPQLVGMYSQDHLEDARFDIFAIAFDAARTFFPVGSGFGTFEAVYLIHDRPHTLTSEYINHAHNDWLEIVIEGGVLALAAAGAFLVWFARAAWGAWLHPQAEAGTLDIALQRAATLAILLIMLHSFLEFPLRNTAMISLFAMCCALLVPPPGGWQTHPAPARRRRSRSRSRPVERSRPAFNEQPSIGW